MACVLTITCLSKTVLAGSFAFTLPTLMLLREDPTSVFLTKARKLLSFALMVEFTALFCVVCLHAYPHHSHIVYDIIVGFLALLGYGYGDGDSDTASPARRIFCSLCACVFFFAAGGLLFALLFDLFGFSLVLATVLLTIVYLFFSWVELSNP